MDKHGPPATAFESLLPTYQAVLMDRIRYKQQRLGRELMNFVPRAGLITKTAVGLHFTVEEKERSQRRTRPASVWRFSSAHFFASRMS